MYSHGFPHHEGNPLNHVPPQPYPYYPHSIHAYMPPIYHYLPQNPYLYPYHYLPHPTSYPSITHNHHLTPPYQNEFLSQHSTYQNDSLSSKEISQNIESKLAQMMRTIDPSYTPEPFSFPTSHLNTHYPSPSQIHKGNNLTHFLETPPSNPYFTTSDPCDYIPPAKDEIEILKEKIEIFTRMAKDDTANLKAEIRSILKDYLVTL